MIKWVIRRKEDGYNIIYEDTPKLRKLKDEMLKSGKFELVSTIDAPDVRLVKEVPIIEDTLECPLCGYVATNEKQLKGHRLGKHS